MRSTVILFLAVTVATAAQGRSRAVRAGDPPSCILVHTVSQVCTEGAIGDATPGSFSALTAGEVPAIVTAAASALNVDTATIAVVDRAGRVLAVFRKPGADPANDDVAVGVARTAAFFSHDMAPLSSRTVRFISGIHFPPGITNTPSAALYGIENTNRGCDFNVEFNPGKCIPRARRIGGVDCNPTDDSGCGPGIVTGKRFPDDADSSSVNAGGIPLYRVAASGGIVSDGHLLGAIGVAGIAGDPALAEFAAVTGAFGSLATAVAPVPSFPLPEPGNVFIDGVRLPFLDPAFRLERNADGLPTGVRRPPGTSAGTSAGAYVIGPFPGGCAANEYLVGPVAGSRLSAAEVDAIVQRAVSTARRTRAQIRLPLSSYARMVIAVADTDGSILALYRMPDATVFSIDVAVAKSRNVVYFTEAGIPGGIPAGTAVSNRTIGFGAQPFFPPGIDSEVFGRREGPWYRSLFVTDLQNPCSQGLQLPTPNQNGVVFFAGSSPLYRGGTLVGGLGVSGDGIEQDDYVTFHGAGDLLPPRDKWADRVRIDDARLPMFKFPRQPEGVTECGGGPCD